VVETNFIGRGGNGDGPSFSPTPFAWLTGNRTIGSTNLNLSTADELQWNTSEYDAAYFTHSTSVSSDEITVNVAGNYFIALTLPIEISFAPGSNDRVSIQAEIYVNGSPAPGAIGESSYIRSQTGHEESSVHISALLNNLSSGSIIEVYVRGATSVTGATKPVIISGNAGLFIEYIDSQRTVFSGTATRTTSSTNLNQATAYPLQWTEVVSSTGFTHSNSVNPENITLDQAGNYLVFVNLPLETSTAERQNVKILVQVNDVTVPGGEGSQGYIRVTSGHNRSSVHWSGLIYNVSAGGILTVKTQQEADTDPVTVGSKVASIYIERIDSSEYVFFSRGTNLTGGTDWNVTPSQSINWINDDIIDTSTYNHSTTSNQHRVTITTTGDYLLIYNDSLSIGTPNLYRENVKVSINTNGSPVSGAETKCHYIRSANNHGQSSGNLVFLLNNINANDTITVQAERESEGAIGDVTAAQDALLMLWRKQ
jgi:hypothetical protein